MVRITMSRFFLVLVLAASSARAQDVRLTAGESQLAPLATTMESVASVSTEPPMAFPPSVRFEDGGLRISTPPGTRPGTYRIEVTGRGRGGRTVTNTLRFTVEPVTVPHAVSGRPPVILLNGFQITCSGETDSTLLASQDTFGQMATLLQNDGASVTFFNNCAYGYDVPIEELAAELGNYISAMRYTDGTPVTQVDLVAHSLGGLVVRAYLAGLQQNGTFTPLLDPKVHRLVELAVPNFGAFLAQLLGGTQTGEIRPGSSFLWNLNTWNQYGDDLRGVDTVAVVGNLGTHYPPGQMDDGAVSLTSGSLGFTRTDSRTRVVPYCHVPVAAGSITGFFVNCLGSGIAYIEDASHLSAQIVRSFLAGTPDWSSIGKPPSQDAVLSQVGGIMLNVPGAPTNFTGATTALNVNSASGILYSEFLSGSVAVLSGSFGGGAFAATCGPFVVPAGFYSAVRCKSGPVVTGTGPAVTASAAKVVASGGAVTITGSGFGATQCSTCSILLEPGDTPLQVSVWSDKSISIFLPPTSGWVQLVIKTASGSDSIGVVTSAPVLTSVISTITSAASSAPGGIAPGELITIKGSGLGPVNGVSFGLNAAGAVDTLLAGTRVTIGGFAAPVTYASAMQVNAIVPYELAGAASAMLTVSYLGNASALGTVAVLAAQPGVFTFNSTGIGQAAAVNQDRSLNGTGHPAPKGSYLTIYWTGGGVTSPGGVTGSVNGSALRILKQGVTVTVGGIAAAVSYQGSAPGLVDGVLQLNVQLDPATPSGVVPLVVTSGGVSSPIATTVVVQ